MKTCSRCQQQKSPSDFGRNAHKSDGLSCYCKVCKREYQRVRYASPEGSKKRASNRERRRRIRTAVAQYKESLPCADCSEFFPYYVMDFDHTDGDKESEVTCLIRSGCGLDRIMDEIAKCELVCSNCHRIRTFKRLSTRSLTG